MVLLCCGGGGLLVWRSGVTDIVACSNLTISGEYKEAIPHCRSEVARLPQLADGHNNLGWCLTLDGQLQEGLAESRKAVELEPVRETYDTLAMALAVSGQGKEAIQIETEHVMINGEVANDTRHITLGMVYYANGRKQDAHEQWEIARTSSEAPTQKLAKVFEAKYH